MKIVFSPDDIPTPERIAEWQDMIDSLREYARKNLNAWEHRFLNDIELQLAHRKFLRQAAGDA
jgi:hypothetical protein